MIKLIDNSPNGLTNIGITGGEPTLLQERLVHLVKYIKLRYPDSLIHILTNGRAFSDIQYTRKFVGSSNLLFGIPLHSDFPADHDMITQVKGSYIETMKGLYNLAYIGADIELRIVINKMNYQRLPQLANFIWRNLPFVAYISFMGLEDTGYSIKNHDKIWIDPIDYQIELEKTITNLAEWNLDVSIFNIPLCLLRPSLYKFAKITLCIEEFIRDINNSLPKGEEDYLKYESDINFYSVVYLEAGTTNFYIPNSSNNESLEVLMAELKEKVKSYDANNKTSLEKYLNSIAFLFKSDAYKNENEVRLVVKGIEFEKKFDMNTIPPRIYIELESIKKIVKQITLGPKVDKVNEWASVFHYSYEVNAPEIIISHLPYR